VDLKANRPEGRKLPPFASGSEMQDLQPGPIGYPSPSPYPGAGPNAGGPYDRAAADLFQVIHLLRRHLKLIGATTVLGILASLFVVLTATSKYEATAVLRLGESREVLTQGIEQQTAQPEQFVNPLLSAIQLITSRSLLGEVVDETGLRLDPEGWRAPIGLLESPRIAAEAPDDTLRLTFSGSGLTVRTRGDEQTAAYGERVLIDGISFVVTGRPTADRATWVIKPREKVIDDLRDEVRISPRNQTNVVDISYLHPSPNTAQHVVNTLVQSYQRFEAQFAQEQATRRRTFLEEQVTQAEERLSQSQRALASYQRRSQSYDAAGELAAEQQNRMLLRVQMAELESQRRTASDQLDSLAFARTSDERWEILRTLVSSPDVAGNAIVSQMHQRLLEQRSFLDTLTAGGVGAAGNSPEVRRQQELVATAEQDLTNAIRAHVRALDNRALALQDLAARTDSALATIPPQLAEGERLQQMVTTYQALTDQVRQEYQRARMAEAVSVGQADIIDLASLPYEPAPSLAIVKLGLGLFLGLTFGGFGAVIVEFRRRSLSSKEEIESMFRLPVLGVIPTSTDPFVEEAYAKSSSKNGIGAEAEDEEGYGLPKRTSPSSLRSAVRGVDVVKAAEAAEAQRVRSAVHAREAYRMLCTNLFFAGWTREAKTLNITSTVPQEGKTLVTANLAVAMANEGLRVLLIDADVWRGRIHHIFDVPVSPGLGELLRGEVEAGGSDVKQGGRKNGKKRGKTKDATAIRPADEVPGLWLLPRGEWGASPSLLMGHGPLRTLLAELGEDFDVILVDGPPVLAAGSAPVLSAITDGALMLVQAGRTDRASIEEALKALATVGATVLGAILNDPKNITAPEIERYNYYSYATTPS
jgi:succinoglycan biosynthesis transport protein ExoP